MQVPMERLEMVPGFVLRSYLYVTFALSEGNCIILHSRADVYNLCEFQEIILLLLNLDF